jgi:Trypsin
VDVVALLEWMWWLSLSGCCGSVGVDVVAQLEWMCWHSWSGCGGSVGVDVLALLEWMWWLSWVDLVLQLEWMWWLSWLRPLGFTRLQSTSSGFDPASPCFTRINYFIFRYTPVSFERHPQFNEQTEDYDFAIITLGEQVDFNDAISPICLTSTTNDDNRQESFSLPERLRSTLRQFLFYLKRQYQESLFFFFSLNLNTLYFYSL